MRFLRIIPDNICGICVICGLRSASKNFSIASAEVWVCLPAIASRSGEAGGSAVTSEDSVGPARHREPAHSGEAGGSVREDSIREILLILSENLSFESVFRAGKVGSGMVLSP
jgi:hypothetical protein